MSFEIIPSESGLIKSWTRGVPVEEEAKVQLRNAASMPFIHSHLAVMPDVHWGMGATIGSVIATRGAIVPAAVGVDIGCGMMAIQTTLHANDLPDNLHSVRTAIEAAVPHGRTDNGGKNDRGSYSELPDSHIRRWNAISSRYDAIIEKHPKARGYNSSNHMGTLGSGNHFIEVCLDEVGHVWVMLHSGSRGAGNRIGQYFINKAKEEMNRYFIGQHLPDQNLAYLVEKTEIFDDYLEAVGWAQDFASQNRMAMMDATIQALHNELGAFDLTANAVNCHHNYVARERHFGANVLVTRKGAVRARDTDMGIIPGSMGAKSFIVRGKGNRDSFNSCSHGAGRVMSRRKAHDTFTVEDHEAATQGVECRKDKSVIDETPKAYKDIDAVMAAQSDLVEIVHTLKQVVCVKG